MENNIIKQLENIEKSLKWVDETDSMRGPKGENTCNSLIDFRRKLRKKQFALEGNPAAAIYGASQMGKSYLISNLLSVEGSPFKILDGHNTEYVFLDKINPEGNGREATSLITRFSSNYNWINPDFPIKASLLSPTDLVIVLCDSYYNDVNINVNIEINSDSISANVEELYKQFENKIDLQFLINEDEILDIQDYFVAHFQLLTSNITNSTFFKRIPKLISKVSSKEWVNVFSILWNNNTELSAIFSKLIEQYTILDFSREIYIPIKTVMRKHGTVLDVLRLTEIYEQHNNTEIDFEPNTKVLTIKNNQEKQIDFLKSYLCVLTAELTFRLPDELENSKPFLKKTDLLDFPGARNRLGRNENEIKQEHIPQMLLRGKVAYLFNKYSSSEKINILLFCQNSEKSEVQNILPNLLNEWIGDMIGKTKEERNIFIEKSQVPPLFIVSTMFNKDLIFNNNNDSPENIDARNNRWKGRFITVLNEVFGQKEWLAEWTTNSLYFKNIFLLRDFRFSSDTNNQLFKGYNENDKEIEEIVHSKYPTFRQDLRKSFIEYDFVKNHFENPENSWDRAASINEDGTSLIIEKLTLAAENINIAREEKTAQELKAIAIGTVHLLEEFFNSTDKAEILKRGIKEAGDIHLSLDIAFGKNPYFFGNMMNEMMVSNSDVFHLYLLKIRDIEKRDHVDMDKYSGIRLSVPQLSPEVSFEDNLEQLKIHYARQTAHDCQEYFEKDLGINLNELFYGNNERVKNFSTVLAEALETFWFDKYMIENQKKLDSIISETSLMNIQEMLRRLFKKLKVTQIIAARIRKYVDNNRGASDVYEMIADISAEMINKFINSVGLEYYTESNLSDLQKASENINGLTWEHTELEFTQNNRNEVAELITKMGNLPELLNRNPIPKNEIKMLPNYRNYIKWYDLLKAGFVTSSGVPDFDPIANQKLGEIIENCKINTI